ncbi:MAG: transposase [Gammaproteobacteria bacterium]|nr:transposase [Gammaproteobacteria bacterium]
MYRKDDALPIILDNARYHYSKTVKEWVEGNGRINLVFLPVYSPELNLIERLWRFFKKMSYTISTMRIWMCSGNH